MALIKAQSTNFGVDATYWHILSSNIFWKTMRAEVTVVGYVDENARRDGKDFVATKSFNIDILPFAAVPVTGLMEMGSMVYGIVKYKIPEFQDAEDKLEEGQTNFDITQYLPVEETPVVTETVDPNFTPYYPPEPNPVTIDINGNFTKLDENINTIIVDENGNPILDENGNPTIVTTNGDYIKLDINGNYIKLDVNFNPIIDESGNPIIVDINGNPI